ncbi:MAG: Unknown protein [uncultured Aureispira sp.]|uniref:Uncharacterized protein n=1 Tax=uncultured Aureispira sp. TaxID=1331704 RepID=A0A6S6S7N4_9BACT|nr:MAG: Unknown protein [uncultured Aureispira sp.]
MFKIHLEEPTYVFTPLTQKNRQHSLWFLRNKSRDCIGVLNIITKETTTLRNYKFYGRRNRKNNRIKKGTY